MPNALSFDIVRHSFLKLIAQEVFMEFTCRTTYNQTALTAMARAVRKTVRAKVSRRSRLYALVIIGLLLVSLWLSWGKIWQTAANCVIIAALLFNQMERGCYQRLFCKTQGPCRGPIPPIPHFIPTTFL